jgi:hypothetical protein
VTPRCPACGHPLGTGEPLVRVDGDLLHEHCAPADDAETAIATGDYDPGEDYPHGAY